MEVEPNRGEIRFERVNKSFGSTRVLKELSLKVNPGERMILLGPSGCGKSTALRIIAGLEDLTGGQLYLGGRPADDLAPVDRNVAMVFQNYALYPHLSVFDNIAFGLQIRRRPKDEIRQRVQRAAQMLGLDDLLNRRPRELSGGQRQRVALARAIVREAQFFLLDEPLSNLDAQLRSRARAELIDLHDQIGTTMVYVTHDQVEAMTIGHRVAVMSDGMLQQVDAPEVIYNRPANTFVAGFIGNPPMNLVASEIVGPALRLGVQMVKLPETFRDGLASYWGKPVTFGIRPEEVRIVTDRPESGRLRSRVKLRENLGGEVVLHLDCGVETILLCRTKTAVPYREGDRVGIELPWGKCHFFDPASGLSLPIPAATDQILEVAYA